MEFVRLLGAVDVIDYKTTRFETVLKDLDVVIDTVGGDLAERSFPVIRPGGVFVTIAAQPTKEFGGVENIRVARAGRVSANHLKQISELVETNQLKSIVGKVFQLTDARQAQELSQTGHGRGCTILQIN